jgi:amino acid adenylation domain-containing protein
MPQRVAARPAAETSPAAVPALFSAIAARHPDRIALEDASRCLTYRALDDVSQRLAQHLRQAGVGRGDIVALYVERDVDAIAALLGVLKAGAAYLPLDLSYPRKLLADICAESRPAAVLSRPAELEALSSRPFWQCPTLDLAAVLDDRLPGTNVTQARPATEPARDEPGPDDLAYVMYTSGSTGRHKGVMVPHRAVIRLVRDADFARLDEDQVLLQLAPLSFDASTFEIWGALLNGAKLAVLPGIHPAVDDIAAAIARHGVTTLWLTAGLFHLMVELRLEALRPLRQLLAGGDVLSPAHVARALAALPGTAIINGYGPTENTTFTCCHRIVPADCRPGPIPIGRPIAGTTARLCDEALRPVPPGDIGELCIGGQGLALGYLHRPELTRERFVQDPDGPAGTRLYRTGDRARRRSDGSLEFLGRMDRQVKIDGKRVELEEIEAGLRRCAGIRDAAAICLTATDGRRQIAAYATLEDGRSGSVERLRGHLRRVLPQHMMPASVVFLDKLPLTPAGKLDRAALPAPDGASPIPAAALPDAAGAGRELRSHGMRTEAVLRRMWQRVLAREAVGLDENFFDLGGTSLQLLKLHAEIGAALGCDLSIVDLFRFPRIRTLARHIDSGIGAEARRQAPSVWQRAASEAEAPLPTPPASSATGP